MKILLYLLTLLVIFTVTGCTYTDKITNKYECKEAVNQEGQVTTDCGFKLKF